jgi:hypothetical protein
MIVTGNFADQLRETLVDLGKGTMRGKAPLYVHSRDRKLSMEMREFLKGLLSRQRLRHLRKDDEQVVVERSSEDHSRG